MEFAAGIITPISDYLVGHVTELSYLLAAFLMIFISDIVLGRLLLRRLKQMNFFARTLVFILYSLFVIPAVTLAGAALLRTAVLEPLEPWIIVVVLVAFVLAGLLLSFRYNMKVKLKG